jgi:ABC-type polysaccharide/polyol phosphate export permease
MNLAISSLTRNNLTLFTILLRRELSNQYLGSVTSVGWALLAPLVMLAIYGYVFGQIFKVRFPEAEAIGFLGYLALGMWPWIAFSDSLGRAIKAIKSNAALVHKTAVPHEIFVYSKVLATFLIHLLGYAVVLFVLALMGKPILWLMLPVTLYYLCLVLALTIGLALFLAALDVFLNDVEHAVPLLLTMWFFATPILYSPSLLSPKVVPFLDLNPMAYIISSIREAMLQGIWMPSWRDGAALVATVCVLLGGRWFFNRCSSRFEDFL